MASGPVDQDGAEPSGARALAVLGGRVAHVKRPGRLGTMSRQGLAEDRGVRLRRADLPPARREVVLRGADGDRRVRRGWRGVGARAGGAVDGRPRQPAVVWPSKRSCVP